MAANQTSYNAANSHFYAAKGGRNGKGVPRLSAKGQIRALQRVALADATSADTPVAVRASLMRAYVDLQELRMNLEGIGRPKPVEARNATPKRKTRSAPPSLPLSKSKDNGPQSSNTPAPKPAE